MTKQEAIHELEDIFSFGFYNSKVDEAVSMAIEALSADTVEVARCKDCKYSQIFNGLLLCIRYYGMGHDLQETDFCSYGERNEE